MRELTEGDKYGLRFVRHVEMTKGMLVLTPRILNSMRDLFSLLTASGNVLVLLITLQSRLS